MGKLQSERAKKIMKRVFDEIREKINAIEMEALGEAPDKFEIKPEMMRKN
jgi:hypothetical protein